MDCSRNIEHGRENSASYKQCGIQIKYGYILLKTTQTVLQCQKSAPFNIYDTSFLYLKLSYNIFYWILTCCLGLDCVTGNMPSREASTRTARYSIPVNQSGSQLDIINKLKWNKVIGCWELSLFWMAVLLKMVWLMEQLIQVLTSIGWYIYLYIARLPLWESRVH